MRKAIRVEQIRYGPSGNDHIGLEQSEGKWRKNVVDRSGARTSRSEREDPFQKRKEERSEKIRVENCGAEWSNQCSTER